MRYLFLIFFVVHLLHADIDSLIESMQNVSDEKRFELMNHFKEEVIKLQEEERMEAMLKLISITESNNSKAVLKEIEENEQESIEEVGNTLYEVHHSGNEDISVINIDVDSHEANEIEESGDDK